MMMTLATLNRKWSVPIIWAQTTFMYRNKGLAHLMSCQRKFGREGHIFPFSIVAQAGQSSDFLHSACCWFRPQSPVMQSKLCGCEVSLRHPPAGLTFQNEKKALYRSASTDIDQYRAALYRPVFSVRWSCLRGFFSLAKCCSNAKCSSASSVSKFFLIWRKLCNSSFRWANSLPVSRF